MAIDLDLLARITSAGHPDTALVGMPVSMVREIEQQLRVASALEVASQRTMAAIHATLHGDPA